MPDLYLNIADQSDETLAATAASMDARANEPAMREICADYMGRLPGPGARLLEVGCGNGAATELIVQNARPAALVGIDPAAGLLSRATARFAEQDTIDFALGDALQSGQPAASFDCVVAHTVYSHLPDPQGALAEAWRVLRPGGTLAVFDGDYATNTVALFDGDPLQTAMEATRRNLIHAPYIMRRLPRMMTEAGFTVSEVKAHGYVQTAPATYLRSVLARGTTAAANAGEIGVDLARALQNEAERRIAAGTFYGAILFLSVLAVKPG